MPPLPTTFPESSPQMLHDAPSTNLVTGFFQKYEFQNYKHDPDAPLEQEFNRLSIARKWGVAKRKTKKELFDKAVKEQKEKNSTNKLEAYFKEKEFVNYKYNPNEAPEIEFTRLCKARQWGRYRVKEERKLFNELVKEPKRVADAGSPSQGGAKTFPSKGTQNDGNKLTVNSPKAQPRLEDIGTARFFKNEASKSTCGYKFLGRSRQEELKDLIGLMKSGYENEKIKDRDDTASEHGPENEVRKGFYMAVEEEFNWVLKNLIMRGPERVKKLKPWEYLVELFGVGKAPISREGAEKAFLTVYVNIFDILDDGIEAIEKQLNFGALSAKVQRLRFSNEKALGVYSKFTRRVFWLHVAVESGTLILLLEKIRQHFHEDIMRRFLDEVRVKMGFHLPYVKKKGPEFLRELILSHKWDTLQ